MEESEKRKERLKAMRTAASEAESFSNNESLSAPSCLSNPLNESSGPQSVQEESVGAPRFDFYTNPMAAFSGNRRTNAANPTQQNHPTLNHVPQSNRGFPSPSGLRNLESSPSPAHQWQPRFSPNQRPYQPHNPQQTFAPYQNPRGNFRPNEAYPPPSFYHPPNPPSGYNNMPSHSYGNSNFPRSHGFPTSSPRHSPHPNFTPRHGGSQWHGNSNFQGQGRGQSYGRHAGRGFHGRGSGSGPERLYDKSMVEDPWKDLSPVVWTPIESPPTNSGAWMPHSIRSKKSKVENSNKFSGGSNLAEFLAASFNDTVNDSEKEADAK